MISIFKKNQKIYLLFIYVLKINHNQYFFYWKYLNNGKNHKQ
jgi:hypothetical protein